MIEFFFFFYREFQPMASTLDDSIYTIFVKEETHNHEIV